MEKFIIKLRRDYPHIIFLEADLACWSPEKGQVSYHLEETEPAIWTVLHELGHALLDHRSYESDLSLLQKEIEAWEKAQAIGQGYRLRIDTDYVQDCLDTYRDWLHKRSTCPECGTQGVQQSQALYSCFNCRTTWEVSPSRFCRPYRLKKAAAA